MKTSLFRFTGLFLGMTAVCAMPQSFNVDLDVFFGEPYLGNGAPSAQFGAAAGQRGFWNRKAPPVGIPTGLADLSGSPTTVTMLRQADNPGGVGGFFFPGNTGDYALLLNDAEQVATLGPGGTLTYTFSGLAPGGYDIYTYAVSPLGLFVATPIIVPEATQSQVQVATGPMPGNAFEYLVTHTIHRVDLAAPGNFHVSITQPPQYHTAMFINGFQIVMVPEPSSALVVAFGTAIVLFRLNKSRHGPTGLGGRDTRLPTPLSSTLCERVPEPHVLDSVR